MQRDWPPKEELPQFKDTLSDWAEFRQAFHTMANGQYTEAVYILQLKRRIPKEGRNLLSGVTEIAEPWQVLDNYYGIQKMFIASVVEKLQAVKLAQGSAHNSMEQLCQAIQAATYALREVSVGSCLEYDHCRKPTSWTWTGTMHQSFQGQGPTWRKFVGWALGMRELSNSARAREDQQELYRDTTPLQSQT